MRRGPRRLAGALWGLVGALAGGGIALVGVVLDGISLFERGLYPRALERRQMLALDVASLLGAG